MTTPLTKPITRLLENIGSPRCPTCGAGQGEDVGKQEWVVRMTPSGVEFRQKGSRKGRGSFSIDWRDVLNAAIRKGIRHG